MKKAKMLSCILAVALIAASLGACSKDETGEVSVLQNRKETMAKVVSLEGDQITIVLADMPEQGGTESDDVSSATTTAVRTSMLVADDSTAAQSTPPEGEPPQGEGPGGGGPGGTPPEDGTTPPDGGGTPPSGQPPASDAAANGGTSDSTAGQAAQPGQQDKGSGQSDNGTPPEPGQGGGEIQFSDEEVTFSLSSDLKVMKRSGEEDTEIDLSEIKEGSVIMFTTVTDEDGNEVIDTIRILE